MQQKNKNDSVRLSSRYQQYMFSKQHLRKRSGGEVFPIGEGSREITQDAVIIDGYNKNYRKDYGSIRTNAGCHTACNLIQENKPKHSNDRVYSDKGLSPTLNTMQGGNRQPFVKGEAKIRRLTPTECMRLQGFPDDWCDVGADGKLISDCQKYKMAGNAVTVNVVAEIIKRLIK